MSSFRRPRAAFSLTFVLLIATANFSRAATTVQDLGQAAIGASTSATITIPLTGAQVAANPTFSLRYGLEFSTGACTPNANGCTLPVTFTPQYPGLRQDAVIVKDSSSGAVLGEAFLHAIGLGPQIAFAPGLLKALPTPPPSSTEYDPAGLAVDPAGVIYISDYNNSVIRKIDPGTANLSIYAGIVTAVSTARNSGDGGPATSATFAQPAALALDAAGNLFIGAGGLVRKVDGLTGIVTTVAGGGTNPDGDGASATSAELTGVASLATDFSGNLYICQQNPGRIRKVDANSGIISTVAGSSAVNNSPTGGDGGLAVNATLVAPVSVALDSAGNLYIADSQAAVIRKVDAASNLISTVAGIWHQQNFINAGDGQPAVSTQLAEPSAVAVDAAGNVYFADQGIIRKVSASTGLLSTIAGTRTYNSYSTSVNNFPATVTPIFSTFLSFDSAGNLYTQNYEILTGAGALFFGPAIVGQTSTPLSLTLANTGTQPLTITPPTIDPEFIRLSAGVADCSASSSLPAAGSCTISLAFAPTQTGAVSGTLTETDNTLNQPNTQQQVNLRGPFTNPTVSTTTVNFGSVNLGSSAFYNNLTIANAGDEAAALQFSFTGPGASDYSFQYLSCASNGSSSAALAPGANCSAWLVFKPSASGPRNASLLISDASGAPTQTITLTGAGTQPGVALSTRSLVFPPQPLGTVGVQSITLTNPGTGPLTIQSISTPNNSFYVSPTSTCQGFNAVLAAGASCTIVLEYSPSAETSASGTLYIYDNATGSPQTVSLAASGAPALSLTGSTYTINFSGENIFTPSPVQTVTIYNYTAAPVTNINLAIAGANPGDFLQANNCPATLASNSYCTASVVFFPQLIGSRSASLAVTSSAGSFNVLLSASGFVNGGVYEIINALTGKALDLSGGSTANGTRIQQNALSGLPQQQWRFLFDDNGYYRITNSSSNQALDVTGQSTANGAPLQLYTFLYGENQEWQFIPVDDIHYKIVNRLSGKVLDVTGGASANGTPIQQWDYLGNPQQLWILVPALPYNITNTLSNNVLDVAGASTSDGASILQSAPNGQRQQQWQLIPSGGGYFAIMDMLTGKVLDVTGESTANGTALQQWDYLGGANQQWQLVPVSLVANPSSIARFAPSTFNFKIVNRLSGKVLDNTGSSLTSGTGIQQWDYLGGLNQQWQLTPILSYTIQSASSNLVLDVPGGSTTDGTNIQQWSSNGNLQQQWQIVPVTPGYFAILNNLTSKALEVSSASTADGALVDQATFTSVDNQLWQITGNSTSGYYPLFTITNKQSGKVLDVTGSSQSNGTLLQQWNNLNGTNQQWYLLPGVN